MAEAAKLESLSVDPSNVAVVSERFTSLSE